MKYKIQLKLSKIQILLMGKNKNIVDGQKHRR